MSTAISPLAGKPAPQSLNEGVISVAAGRVAVRVIHTDEERTIAHSVCRVLGLGPST